MSERQKRSLSALLSLLVLVGIGWSVVASAGGPAVDREIRLEARDMAFYLEGDLTPNPTLVMSPGEVVRVVLVNREPGVQHDVAVDSLALATPLLSGAVGSTASLVIEAPPAAGDHEYVCTLHRQMMRGLLLVR